MQSLIFDNSAYIFQFNLFTYSKGKGASELWLCSATWAPCFCSSSSNSGSRSCHWYMVHVNVWKVGGFCIWWSFDSQLMKKKFGVVIMFLRFHAFNFAHKYSTSGLGTSTVVIWFVQLMPWKAVSTCPAKSLEPLPPAIHPAFLAVLVGLPLPLPQTGNANAKKPRICPRYKSPKSFRNKQKWLQLSKTSAMGIDKQFKCATLWSRIRAC